jgi:hypothetical protein
VSHSIETLTTRHEAEQDRELALLDRAQLAIHEATTVREVKEIRDKAEALEIYAKRAEYGEILQQRCAEIKLRAERRAGELLKDLNLRPGRPAQDMVTNGNHYSLDSIGITKKESSKWQRLAGIPDDRFDAEVVNGPSEAALLRLAAALEREAHPPPPAPVPEPVIIEGTSYTTRPFTGMEDFGVTTVLLNQDTGEVVAYFCDEQQAREVADMLD